MVRQADGPNRLKPIAPQQKSRVGPVGRPPEQSFDSVLSHILGNQSTPKTAHPVKFSGHALERLRTRNIEMSPERLKRLDEAIEKASSKGSRESLVLMDDIALVVSIKNNVVITAASGKELRENVFTNIDSAVIV